MRWLGLIVLLAGCKIDCENLPVHQEILAIPIRVEEVTKDELEACQKDAAFWKEMATYYRDNACVYGQEGL